MTGLAINGRFRTQGLTGVQRFAMEVTAAMDARSDLPPTELLLPPGATFGDYARVRPVTVGRRSGQAWEQIALPAAARGKMLINLGNTAPLWAGRNQAVVIHDAGIFDTPESYALAFRGWYRFMHHALARLGARLITVSEFSRGRIADRLGIDPARIGVMPEGGEHVLRTAADMAVLDKHGLQPGRFALTVGSRAAHKNLDALRDAAAMLADRGMVLAAAGAADPAVFRAAGGGGAVALGRVTDAELRALYENAFCLVFPSRYEGFGLPPLEAMTCGCPVIAARSGAVPEVCGEAALWFDSAIPASLTEALIALIDQPGLAQTQRAAGLLRAEHFTWARAAETLLGLLPEQRP